MSQDYWCLWLDGEPPAIMICESREGADEALTRHRNFGGFFAYGQLRRIQIVEWLAGQAPQP